MDCLLLSWPLVIDEDVCLMRSEEFLVVFVFKLNILSTFCWNVCLRSEWDVVFISIYDRFDLTDMYSSVMERCGTLNFRCQFFENIVIFLAVCLLEAPLEAFLKVTIV